MLELVEQDLRAAYGIAYKKARYDAVDAVKARVIAHFFPEGAETGHTKEGVAGVFKELEAKIVRWNILDTGKRIDGRDVKTVRPIVARSASCPAPTARRCSPAARPRPSWWRRWHRRWTSRSWTR